MSKNIELWSNWIVTLVPSVIAWWRYRNFMASPEKQYLTFWPRLWATFIDDLVLLPLATAFTLILQSDGPVWLLTCVYFIHVWYRLVYRIYMHGKYGQTIGKMITHVEIFDAKTHNPIAFRHAVIRDGFPILVLIATLGYAAYCLTISKTTIDHYVIGKFPPEVATDITILGMIYWCGIGPR
ncbi:MAG: RDD family protein [Candidatus Latescibacteria bacterium]|nr:RDD family protein [Candidatus Latescibacterota bacterium]